MIISVPGTPGALMHRSCGSHLAQQPFCDPSSYNLLLRIDLLMISSRCDATPNPSLNVLANPERALLTVLLGACSHHHGNIKPFARRLDHMVMGPAYVCASVHLFVPFTLFGNIQPSVAATTPIRMTLVIYRYGVFSSFA